MSKREKNVKVSFFLTGQDDKRQPILTGSMFDGVWKEYFSDALLRKPISEKLSVGEAKAKDLILYLDECDSSTNEYFGYIGVFRDSILPTIFSKVDSSDKNIPLEDTDEILEKSYFSYKSDEDILVFQQNRLGPRADDLAYFLFKASGVKRVTFVPILQNEDIKQLLEGGSTLKNGHITIALPRRFNPGDLQLSNSWSNDVIKMMSQSGMNKINLQFWGRASVKKGECNYVVDTVRDGIKELLAKCSLGSERSKMPSITKAEAQLSGGGRKNLLNQELCEYVLVDVEKGYASRDRIKLALYLAYIRQKDTLAVYVR
ncbi:hypothetical protein ACLH0G_04785 [Aeromonas rivipollensis]|uniref:hypothetical protein n=1 Tax=Aeromonas rivipollensis TaxID=948519 RepID=UPI003D0150A0